MIEQSLRTYLVGIFLNEFGKSILDTTKHINANNNNWGSKYLLDILRKTSKLLRMYFVYWSNNLHDHIDKTSLDICHINYVQKTAF